MYPLHLPEDSHVVPFWPQNKNTPKEELHWSLKVQKNSEDQRSRRSHGRSPKQEVPKSGHEAEHVIQVPVHMYMNI